MISVGALTPILVCFHKLEITPLSNFNHSRDGTRRRLRPCVIQREVTNGYRTPWAAQAEGDARAAIDTARLVGENPFDVVIATLA